MGDSIAAPPAAVGLRTERAPDPIGVDEPRPLLSWRLAPAGRDQTQRAYRILVAREGDPLDDRADIGWDSGEVESAETVDIPYGGPEPDSRTRYGWRVRVVDGAGQRGPWSDLAWWETGLRHAGDWSAEWVTSPAELAAETPFSLDVSGPLTNIWRIWADPGGGSPSARFRTVVTVPGDNAAARARIAVAGAAELACYLNGTPIPAEGEVPKAVRPGRNVLAIAARSGHSGQVPGLVAHLRVDLTDGGSVVAATDDRWRCLPGGGDDVGGDDFGGDDVEWTDPEYDDASWPRAWGLALHGAPPWGREPLTHRPSPYLRRAFTLGAPVRRARLYATALGVHELWLSGQRVSDDRLAPGWTEYRTRIPYQTYDVTELVHEGRNVLGAVLGDGWYAGHVCWFGTFHYGRHRALRAQLVVDHTDGTTTVVGTDGQWRTGTGAVRYADLQNGEVVDARAEPLGWASPDFDDTGWAPAVLADSVPTGRIEAQVAPAVRPRHELPARSVTELSPGVWIVDFGQNLVGWVRLRVPGGATRRIVIRHAEALQHTGELYLENLRTARATDEYSPRGTADVEVFEPRFTVHGFRYCEITGLTGPLSTEDVTAIAAYADMPQIGEFSCSDERVNRLQANIVWGQRGNFLSVPTDCPQRDERLGWTGDAQVFAGTATFNYDVRRFFRKWLRDLRDAQRPSGAIPFVAPDVLTPQHPADLEGQSGAAGWGDAIEVVPERLLTAYGDRRATEECYPAVLRWLSYLERNDGAHNPGGGFGDWLAMTPTPTAVVIDAYHAYALRVAARLARALGRDRDAAELDERFARVRATFRERHVGGGGRVAGGTQTAYVLALHIGLLTSDEVPRAVDRLVRDIEARGDHLSTGFLGTGWLLDALTDNGRIDVAYRLLQQDTWPSWLYPVVYGDATTIWERWDSWSDSRGFADPGMTSFNHYAYGAVGEWMYRTIAGLNPAADGYRRILVRPRPGGGLTWARGRLDTVHGELAVAWRIDESWISLDVTIPPNTTAEVHVPTADADTARTAGVAMTGRTAEAAVFHVGSGRYAFEAASPV